MRRSPVHVWGGALAIATAVLTASFIPTPASAAQSGITLSEERSVRATMHVAGLSSAVVERLIAKLRAGEQLDSELETVAPESSVTTMQDAGVVTTATYPDGSIRTTVELERTLTGASARIYVAHPTLECNLIHCTLIYSRADTKYMATASFNTVSAIVAAACRPAAWACGIAVGVVIDTTHNAYSSGRCVGLQKVLATGPVYPVIVSCRK